MRFSTTLLLMTSLPLMGILNGCGTRDSASLVPITDSVPITEPLKPTSALAADLDAIFNDPKFACAHWGVRVETLDGKVVYDLNGEKGFMPASTMKIFTSAAAADLLGADYTYETRVDAIGHIDEEGTLHGHVVITGSGDPTLGAWHPDPEVNSEQLLEGWVASIRTAGINRIDGDIVGDGRFFTKEFVHPDYSHSELSWWYTAGSSGLAMEENAFRVKFYPGKKAGDPVRIDMVPKTDYVTVINNMVTVPAGEPNDADSVWRDSRGNTVLFEGGVTVDNNYKDERGSIHDGARYAAWLFRAALEDNGITVTGEAANIRDWEYLELVDEAPADQRIPVTRTISPSMAEILHVINKPSHNFFADQVLRTMGAIEGGEGSFSKGTDVVQDWLEEIGAPASSEFHMVDGSGLSNRNVVQPRQMTYVLRYMRTTSLDGDAFYDSLSTAGVDGWLKNRMAQPPAQGNVRAKTGYIDLARTLSGYLTTADGQELAFSMLCNFYMVPLRDVNRAQDEACQLLAGTELGSGG